MSSVKTDRQSNFELLRIVAMLMIIAHHISYHGALAPTGEVISFNAYWLQLMVVGGKIGVNLFVMISGYFSVTAKSFKPAKAVQLWLQLLFYSLLTFFADRVYSVFNQNVNGLNLQGIGSSFFPVINNSWWFASAFFALFMLSPFINKMLVSLNSTEYLKMLAVMFVMWTLIYTFALKNYQMNHLLWFIFVYSLGGYIRLYGGKRLFSKKYMYFISAIVSLLTLAGLKLLFEYCGVNSETVNDYKAIFYKSENSLPILFVSVCVFLLFKNLDIKRSRFINTLASAAFGVYLIHDSVFVREMLKSHVFKVYRVGDSPLIPYTIAIVLAIYISCAILELLRIYILEKNYMKLVNILTDKLSPLFNGVLTKTAARGEDKRE